ncbi:MAG: hypothetical protein WB559_08340 [Candidatus Acidiferrales bacterium]
MIASTPRKLTWSLTDFRVWWTSPARFRWCRALRLAPVRDLTNFGDTK